MKTPDRQLVRIGIRRRRTVPPGSPRGGLDGVEEVSRAGVAGGRRAESGVLAIAMTTRMWIQMKRKTVGWLKRCGEAAWSMGRVLLAFIGWTATLLATGARTTPPDDAGRGALNGGVLNYRTSKLDDGTDPYGWYERD